MHIIKYIKINLFKSSFSKPLSFFSPNLISTIINVNRPTKTYVTHKNYMGNGHIKRPNSNIGAFTHKPHVIINGLHLGCICTWGMCVLFQLFFFYIIFRLFSKLHFSYYFSNNLKTFWQICIFHISHTTKYNVAMCTVL